MPQYIYRPEGARIPIKIWMDRDEYESLNGVKEQAENLARLPFAFHHIALMPDAHKGYGMPIGGVLATKGHIVPNAVGVDIGCGMNFVATNIDADEFKQAKTADGTPLLEKVLQDIQRRVPVGFAHHSRPQPSKTFEASEEFVRAATPPISQHAHVLLSNLDEFKTALGTLGGGNHFIEVQAAEDNLITIMIHTGSRHFGYTVAHLFNKAAEELNERYFSAVPKEWELPFLPTDDLIGQEYISWMLVAQAFARENREKIMSQAKEVLQERVAEALKMQVEFTDEVNIHHNYASMENHFGQNVWVHRKGAIQAREGTQGIIPGAMGTDSYIVEGLGQPDSFTSASHGAGRKMSRMDARRTFKPENLQADFLLSVDSVADVVSEWKGAYKDIDEVLANEADLVKPVLKLRTLGVIKARDERRW